MKISEKEKIEVEIPINQIGQITQIQTILNILLQEVQAAREKTQNTLNSLSRQIRDKEFEEGDFFNQITPQEERRDSLKEKEARIFTALKMVEAGTYGKCEKCGKETIPLDKLPDILKSREDWHLIPMRISCVACSNGQKRVDRIVNLPKYITSSHRR